MAESVEQGSLETVLHIDIDKNDVTAITKQLSAIAKDSTLQNGFKALGDTMSKSIVSSTSGFDRLQASIERVADIIAELEERITGLPTSIAKNTLAKSAKESASEFEQLRKKVDELSSALANNDKVQSSTGKTTNLLIQQQRQLKAELSNLIATGQQATPQFKEIEARYAAITDEIADMQQRVKALANDEGFTQGMIQGLGGLAASFQVAQGAIGMFADENEELNKILVKVQSLMGIVNGLMTIQQTINKDSVFMQTVMNKASEKWAAIKAKAAAIWAKETAATVANTSAKAANNIQTQLGTKGAKESATSLAADTAAETANTASKQAGATANGVLSKSFKTLGVAIKSIPGVGWLLAAIAAVVAAIKLIGDSIDEEKQKEKELIEAREESFSVFAKESLLLEENIRKVEKFNGTQKEEAALVSDLNSKYGDNLGHFQTLAEWKQVLIDKGQQYVNMLMLESQAEALRNKAAETYAKKIKTQALDADQLDEANGTAEKALKTLLSGPFAAFTAAYQYGVAGVIEDVNERTKKELLETLDAEEKAYKDELEKILQDLDEARNKLNQGRPDAEFTYIQKLQNDLKNVQDVIQTVDQFGSGAMRNGVFVSLDELKKEEQGIQDLIRQFNEMTGQETYLQKLQRLRADAQREIERTDPNNVAAINRAKIVVHNIDEQIKRYQDLTTYHTYIQKLQLERTRTMEKLEAMNTTKASQAEIDKQKEIIKNLDKQIKAHQDKITIETYYENVQRRISDKEKELKDLSLSEAQDTEKVDRLKQELKQLEEEKQAYEDLISTNTYYQNLQQSISRDKEKLNSLTEEELKDTEAIDKLRANIAKNQEKQRQYEEATRTDFSSKINAYKSYANEIVKIEDDRRKKVAAIDANNNLSAAEKAKQKSSVESAAKLRSENAAAQYEIEDPAMVASLKTVVDKALGMSMEEIQKRMPQVIKEIKQLEKKGGDNSGELARLNAELQGLTTQFDTLQEKEGKAFEKMGSDKKMKLFQEYFNGIADTIGNAINELDGLSDEAKETMNTILDFATSGMDMIGNIDMLVKGTTKGMETTSKVAAQSISTVEKASVILAIISAAIQIAVKIANLFSNKRNEKANKTIERLQDQVDTLQESYDLLGEKIDNAYGKSAVDLINEQDVLLRQQKELIKQQIEAEKTKKDKKQDTDQIKEWEKQIKEIDKTLEGRQETIVEALIGKDYKSVLEDFSSEVMSAMDDAETSVDQATKNIAKSIKKAAVQTRLNEILQNDANKYADTLAKAMEDGFLSEFEKRNLEQIENTIASTSENYLKQFDDLWEKAEEERNGASRGVNSMSQDSADEMNGRLTQIQSHTFSINENTKSINDFASRQLVVLQGIHTDTSSLVSVTNSIRATLDDITIKGVKLKA